MEKTHNDRIADVIVEGLYFVEPELHPQDAYGMAYKIMADSEAVKKLTIPVVVGQSEQLPLKDRPDYKQGWTDCLEVNDLDSAGNKR